MTRGHAPDSRRRPGSPDRRSGCQSKPGPIPCQGAGVQHEGEARCSCPGHGRDGRRCSARGLSALAWQATASASGRLWPRCDVWWCAPLVGAVVSGWRAPEMVAQGGQKRVPRSRWDPARHRSGPRAQHLRGRRRHSLKPYGHRPPGGRQTGPGGPDRPAPGVSHSQSPAYLRLQHIKPVPRRRGGQNTPSPRACALATTGPVAGDQRLPAPRSPRSTPRAAAPTGRAAGPLPALPAQTAAGCRRRAPPGAAPAPPWPQPPAKTTPTGGEKQPD